MIDADGLEELAAHLTLMRIAMAGIPPGIHQAWEDGLYRDGVLVVTMQGEHARRLALILALVLNAREEPKAERGAEG
jgi:hypothetical protein